MGIKLSKTIYRTIIIASFIALNLLVIFGIGSAWAFLNTGADRTSMLHLEVPMNEVYRPNLEWTEIDNPGRTMEEQTLGEITNDYMNAWHVRNIAYKKNDYYGIKDYYTDSARTKLYANIDLNVKNDNWFKRTTLNHTPDLDFYSTDGTIVVFKDHNVEEYQEIYQGEELLFAEKDTTSYHVMMLLEDGFWRIRHLNEIPSTLDKTIIAPRNIAENIKKVENIKGINYYPKNSPWDTFGKRFNDSIIRDDFKIINTMGLNTIRIFIQYEDFGNSRVNYKKINLLKKILDAAHDHNLDAVITLFDFYGDYDVSNWTLTHRHAQAIVNAVKDHPALLAWDIKNEPDLDFDSRGKLRVLSWLAQMIENIKKWDRNHPVTIGWSSPEAGADLASKVDFISYHYYRDIDKYKEAHNTLKKIAPTKPKVLQEYGMSSYKGLWNLYTGANEEGQLAYYKEMQKTLKKENIPYMFWTLYDFEKVPSSVAGSLPWKTRKQHFFGCLDSLGNKKPAYYELVSKKGSNP
jgi:hypothetical protein